MTNNHSHNYNSSHFHDYMKGYMVGSALGNSRQGGQKPSKINTPSDLGSVALTLLGWLVGGSIAVVLLALLAH